jgi:uncharacterized protein with GYD domain
MSTYVLLLTLTPAGQALALADPEHLLRAEEEVSIPGVVGLGLYAVLGPYDFVTIVEADNNEQVARFSIELGVKAGVHVTTLPAIPISRLDKDPKMAGEGAVADVGVPEDSPIPERTL